MNTFLCPSPGLSQSARLLLCAVMMALPLVVRGTSITLSGGTTLVLSAQTGPHTVDTLLLAGGNLFLDGQQFSIQTLTLTESSVIDMAGGASTLLIGAASPDWNGHLAIHNYTKGEDHIYFSAPDLDATRLAQIQFYRDAGQTPWSQTQFSGNELVSAPEPATLAVWLLSLGLIGRALCAWQPLRERRESLARWISTRASKPSLANRPR